MAPGNTDPNSSQRLDTSLFTVRNLTGYEGVVPVLDLHAALGLGNLVVGEPVFSRTSVVALPWVISPLVRVQGVCIVGTSGRGDQQRSGGGSREE